MVTTVPATNAPHFYLESKHADIQAFRGEDFHYSWKVGGGLLTVEYIPANWPCLTVSVGDVTVEKMKATLDEIGFELSD